MLRSVNKIFNTTCPKIRVITSGFHTSKPVFFLTYQYCLSYGVLLPEKEISKIEKIAKNGKIDYNRSHLQHNFELNGESNKKLFESEIYNKNITDGIEILNEGFRIIPNLSQNLRDTKLLTVGKVSIFQTGCVIGNMMRGPLRLFDESLELCFGDAKVYIDNDITPTAGTIFQNKNKNDILENMLSMSGIDVNENVYNLFDLKNEPQPEHLNELIDLLKKSELKKTFGYYICA